MKIILNGKETTINAHTTLTELVSQTCKNPQHVIVELNEKIVKSDRWTATPLQDADKVELVTFVGGG